MVSVVYSTLFVLCLLTCFTAFKQIKLFLAHGLYTVCSWSHSVGRSFSNLAYRVFSSQSFHCASWSLLCEWQAQKFDTSDSHRELQDQEIELTSY